MKKYHEIRNYGFNKIIKNYLNFPWYLPLPAHSEHGWTPIESALKSDLAANKPLMFVFNKHRAKLWSKKSDVPAYIIGSPFIHFRKSRGIKQKKDAKGTVVFPSHSTFDIKSNYSVEQFCDDLNNLPDIFKPITVCLFYLDFIKKTSWIYKNAGFEVVTAGPKFTNSLDFPKRFYNILSSHRYTASNSIGSYTFYAVDLGIPFFLLGEKPRLNNIGDRDVNLRGRSREQSPLAKEATKLFSTGPVSYISSKQKAFVNEQLGKNDQADPEKLNELLWDAFYRNRYYRYTAPYWISSIYYLLLFNSPLVGPVIRFRSYLRDRWNI